MGMNEKNVTEPGYLEATFAPGLSAWLREYNERSKQSLRRKPGVTQTATADRATLDALLNRLRDVTAWPVSRCECDWDSNARCAAEVSAEDLVRSVRHAVREADHEIAVRAAA